MADKHGFGTQARNHELLSVLRWRRGFIKS